MTLAKLYYYYAGCKLALKITSIDIVFIYNIDPPKSLTKYSIYK